MTGLRARHRRHGGRRGCYAGALFPSTGTWSTWTGWIGAH